MTAGRRNLVIGAAVLCGLASVVLLGSLVVGYGNRLLPFEGRTAMLPAPRSDQVTSGRHWYTARDAEALSAELATAVEGTDWCLGWSIVVLGDGAGIVTSGGPINSEPGDVGSNRGPDVSARTCPEWAEVMVTYVYTSASSEQEDNASFDVASSDARLAAELVQHPALRVSSSDLLHEDRGTSRDDVIGNAIAALPLALAEEGRIDPLTVEPVAEDTEGAVSFADREGEGGSDLFRARGHWLLAGGLAVALGLTAVLMAWARVPARWFGPAAVGLRGADGRAVNPRRALKASLQRARQEEEQGAPGRSVD